MTILIVLFALGYVWQILRYVKAWKSIPETQSTDDRVAPDVSILIPVRNEMAHLEKLIQCIGQQQYEGNMEWLFIDDDSSDGSLEFLKKIPHIRTIGLRETGKSGKKQGIEAGVSMASHEYILQTDADCVFPPTWVRTMSRSFIQGARVVFGPISYQVESGCFFDLAALEMTTMSALCGSSIFLMEPFVGNAANMGYHRSDFLQNMPFISNQSASGDDADILRILVRRQKAPASFAKDHGALVQTTAPARVGQFVSQRLRWASKTSISALPPAALLFAGINFLLFLMYLLCFTGFLPLHILVLLLLIKLSADFYFFSQVLPFFGNRKPNLRDGFFIFLLLVLYPIYSSIIAIFSKFVAYSWKGRKHRA